MFKNYKVKVLMFVGRKRYLQLNLHKILNHPLIDQVFLGINTQNQNDLDYINNYKHGKIKLLMADKQCKNQYDKFYQFYKYTCDNDTIYFKIDDDVIYFSENYFEDTLKFIIDHKEEYLLVYPFIVNNPFFNGLFDQIDINNLSLYRWYIVNSFYHEGYAINIHNRFLNKQLNLHQNNVLIDQRYNVQVKPGCFWYIRPSINAFCYYGETMEKIFFLNHPMFKQDDEQFFYK